MNQPAWKKEAFICPHCKTHATQQWFFGQSLQRVTQDALAHLISTKKTLGDTADIYYIEEILKRNYTTISDYLWSQFPKNLSVATCSYCMRHTYWDLSKLIYPRQVTVESPSEHMPEDVKDIYLEASNILQDSPRGAAALLRLALQKLLPHLGATNNNINDGIAELVRKGVVETDIQKALDSLRVIGNEAVHPGTIDWTEERDNAAPLFTILNYICKQAIGTKKEIDALYKIIPEDKQQAIIKRDTPKAS